jgi:hypothetical protein
MKNQLRNHKGQSLVAVALVTPILLMIIAGVVEVTQLAVTQNRVSTAARNAARYASNGGEDVGIKNSVLNTITQTLIMSSGVWDIWSIRAEVDSSGDIPADSFQFNHIYGDGLTEEYAATNMPEFENDLRLKVQNKLKKDGTGAAVGDLGADLDVVGTYILHDIETILGLNILSNLTGFNTVTGFSVMRQASLASTVHTTGGCRGAFPIALEEHVQTITKSDYDSLAFTHPIPAAKPAWETIAGQPSSPTALRLAKEGNIFKLDLGTGSTDFNWLKWNTRISGINPPPASSSVLGASLLWPGNSDDYNDHGDPPSPDTFRGFADADPSDSSDVEMQIHDWVARDTVSGSFSAAGVSSAIRDHIDKDRALRLVLWNDSAGGYSAVGFQVSGFGIFRLRAYGSDWVLVELVRLDTSCGQS